ncbi:ABC transporter ATP-binding protein [Clostridium scatologenes]|uniref:ABC transporter, ATP-binding protein n=1 Tax=Clostridium scatologenes TaxID=1548 RepID=A0A0E3JY79_CLOSL|nr:ABC transporter ATP-binding protein [Clostridium scatologenes]AKA67302.1 ABC transporter, ATP-binding protein [Clostridium scatologenes]
MRKYKSLIKLVPYMKNYKMLIILGTLGLIASSLIYAPIPYLIGYIIDKVLLKNKNYYQLYYFIFILALLYILRYTVSLVSKALFIKFQNFLINNIRLELIDKILELPMSFLSNQEKGYILGRVSESGNIGTLFSPQFITIFLCIFDFILALFMMLSLSVKLTFIVCITIPIYFFTVKNSSNNFHKITKAAFENKAVLDASTFEILNGIEEIKILNGKSTQLGRYKTNLHNLIDSSIKQNKYIMFFTENISLVDDLSTVFILLISGIMILNGHLTIGTYTAFTNYMIQIFGTTRSFTGLGVMLEPICISIDRVQEIMDLDSEDSCRNEDLTEEILSIRFEELSFKYNKNTQNIINNLNFEINKGDRVLLSGDNGTGKSTLIKIILGLYFPDKGKLLINNRNSFGISTKSIRKRIGIVSQNVFLFKGSVLENILYAQNDKNRQDVVNLISKYNLEKYINNFENKLDTIITQNGSGVSGGQAQLIAFLRAILTKKDVIILDEGTSNLDSDTKKVILNVLEESNFYNILIIISHQKESFHFNKFINLNQYKENS